MSAKKRKILNTWNIALVTLLVGLVLGFQINDVLTSGKIDRLQAEVDTQGGQITTMQAQLSELQGNYTEVYDNLTTVTRLYDELRTSAVLRYIYEELQEDYETRTQELADAVDTISQLDDQINELEEENQELQESYFNLWKKYAEIRVLSWTYFVVNGLEVNLTTTKTVYETNTNVEGTISIYYVGGEPFEGTFELKMWSDFYSAGTNSGSKPISGKTNYSFKSPFIFGTGSYTLSVTSIKDAEGKLVAGTNDLRLYTIPIQWG